MSELKLLPSARLRTLGSRRLSEAPPLRQPIEPVFDQDLGLLDEIGEAIKRLHGARQLAAASGAFWRRLPWSLPHGILE